MIKLSKNKSGQAVTEFSIAISLITTLFIFSFKFIEYFYLKSLINQSIQYLSEIISLQYQFNNESYSTKIESKINQYLIKVLNDHHSKKWLLSDILTSVEIRRDGVEIHSHLCWFDYHLSPFLKKNLSKKMNNNERDCFGRFNKESKKGFVIRNSSYAPYPANSIVFKQGYPKIKPKGYTEKEYKKYEQMMTKLNKVK